MKAKRKSGLGSVRQSYIERSVIQSFIYIYAVAKRDFYPQRTLSDSKAIVWEREDFKRLPNYSQEYIRGYVKALNDIHFSTAIEWRLMVDGVLITVAEKNDLTRKETKHFTDEKWPVGYRSPSMRCELERSTFTYIGRPDKPF